MFNNGVKFFLFLFISTNLLFAMKNNYIMFNSPYIKIQKVEKHKNFDFLFFDYKKQIKNGSLFSSCIINKVLKKNKKNKKIVPDSPIKDMHYDYYLFCAKPNIVHPLIVKLKVINPVYYKNNKKKKINSDFLELMQTIYKIETIKRLYKRQ